MPTTALIVDDEADIRELIAITLTRMGWDFHAAASLEEARNLLGLYPFDLCLTDMHLPDGNGVDFVKYTNKNKPHIPIAVITAHGNMEAAVDAMKNGAYDFVSKPVDISQLRQLVTQAVELKAPANATNEATYHTHPSDKTAHSIENRDSATRSNIAITDTVPASNTSAAALNQLLDTQLIGDSAVIKELHELIEKSSRTNAPVWITGDTGTGIEAIARAIHNQGQRGSKPFITVNCGAIPTNTIERELFGYVEVDSNGLKVNHTGYLLQANGGSLFLDEVEALPLQVQVKVLRAIQERTMRPIGDLENHLVNIRIISASYTDLEQAVQIGKFRQDLYYRLNVIPVRAPSIHERPSDIALMIDHLLSNTEQLLHSGPIRIDEEALSILEAYRFPGNIRELENILEHAKALMENNVIKASDIKFTKNSSNAELFISNTQSTQNAKCAEHQRIEDALNQTHWNRKAAAKLLGLTYRQLRYRIKQLNIDDTH